MKITTIYLDSKTYNLIKKHISNLSDWVRQKIEEEYGDRLEHLLLERQQIREKLQKVEEEIMIEQQRKKESEDRIDRLHRQAEQTRAVDPIRLRKYLLARSILEKDPEHTIELYKQRCREKGIAEEEIDDVLRNPRKYLE